MGVVLSFFALQMPVLLRGTGYESDPVGAFRRLCTAMQKELRRQENFNVTGSGCTACMVLVTPRSIICANVGDSRCVLYSFAGPDSRKVIFSALTVDHKPDRPDERRRIEGRGGVVQASVIDRQGRIHPSRVLANRQDGGLAMSRSLGDTESHTAGVIPDPEVKQHMLSEHDQLLVLASDGVWDVMTEEELSELIAFALEEPMQVDMNELAANICKTCQ